MYKTIDWNDLPHNDQVGFGREGLVLRLSDDKCIKIYSPERTSRAETEFKNYKILKKANFLVPNADEIVNINIGGENVRLPGKCEFGGIGLYMFYNVETVPAIIKDYIPGVPYGNKKPTTREIKDLVDYLGNLHKQGLTFEDGVAPDFIHSEKGTTLVDCSTLVDKIQSQEKLHRDFEKTSSDYQKRIISDFTMELKHNEFMSFSFDVKLEMAKWLSKRSRKNSI